MNRRNTVLLLLALGAAPVASLAQQKKVWRIGFLTLSTEDAAQSGLTVFKESFRQLGYVEDRDYVLDLRFGDNSNERVTVLARELVKSNPDIIVSQLAGPTLDLKRETSTIPIVMVSAGDPIGSGIVDTLGRPGGNITGMSNSLTDIAPKHLDLLREVLPGVSRLGVLMNPKYSSHRAVLKTFQAMAPTMGLQILPIEAESVEEIETGFAAMTRQKAQAVVVVTDAIYSARRVQIADLALKNRLPCIGSSAGYAMLAYGANSLDFYRRAAAYVDKILKGAKPRDLPVAQPTKFDLVINLKTAKALAVKIPDSVLVRADRVIE